LTKGMTDYRAGRYAEAVTWVGRTPPRVGGVHFDATGFAVLALAQHCLGRAKEARTALGSAQAILAENMPDPGAGRPFGGDWHDWLHARILCREAEALLPPDGAAAPFQRGAARSRQGKTAEAAAAYQEAIRVRPDWAEAHYYLGRAYHQLGEREQSIAEYSRAIELAPNFTLACQDRGAAYAALGEWDKAAADYAKVLAQYPDDVLVRYCQALARLGAGDRTEYRSACATMLKRFGETDNSEVAHWVAWTSVLAPDATEEWDRLVKVGETAVRSGTQRHAFTTTLGAALYRAGRFREAIQRLDEASAAWEQAASNPAMSSPAYTWFFLAMAHKRSGHPEEARRWLDKAIRWMEQETQRKDLTWNRGLTLLLLRREAEALLGIKDEKGAHQDKKDTKKNP
jgi:tetratricopeptide (TPR) repeat protein